MCLCVWGMLFLLVASIIYFMDIATAKAEATTRTGLPHTYTHPLTQP